MNHAVAQLLRARAISDLASAQSAALFGIGTRLGLYDALRGGPVTAESISERTGIALHYARPWLVNQAAAGYITFDPQAATYSLSEEQRALLDDRDLNLAAAFDFAVALTNQAARVEAALSSKSRSGEPRNRTLAAAVSALDPEKGRRVEGWLPPETVATLERGGSVLDFGCGDGRVLRHLAGRFPNSAFEGIDSSPGDESPDGVRIHAGDGSTIRPGAYDLVLTLDSFHEVGNPLALARQIHAALRGNGLWIIAEGIAADDVAGNLNPNGRLLSAAEMLLCVPSAIERDGRAGFGPMAGERVIVEILREAGFASIRRVEDARRLLIEARLR